MIMLIIHVMILIDNMVIVIIVVIVLDVGCREELVAALLVAFRNMSRQACRDTHDAPPLVRLAGVATDARRSRLHGPTPLFFDQLLHGAVDAVQLVVQEVDG